MSLESKLNYEGKGILSKLSNNIKKSIVTKAITYGLAGGLALGTGYSHINCGGGGGGGGKQPTSPQAVLAENTKVMDDTSLVLQSIVNDTYTYSYTGSPTAITPGDILLSTKDQGYLREAISVQDLGGTLEVNTKQGVMEEAFQYLNLNFTDQLTPDETIQGVPLMRGVKLEELQRPIGLGEFYVQISNVVLYDGDNNLATTNDQIIMNGDIRFSPEYNLQILIDGLSLKKIVSTVTLNETANLSVENKLAFLQYTNEVELARYYFAPIVIGPVVITPLLKLNVGIDGDAEATVISSINQQASLTGGLRYENDIWSPFADFSNSFNFQLPTLSLGANVKGYVGPQLDLLLYGVTGPSFNTSGYLLLDANPLQIPWWTLYGGLDANAGVSIDIFSLVKLGYQAKFIDYSTPLISACTDLDNDSYGAIGTLLSSCAGSTAVGDCNDNKNTVYPNAPELCDLVDNQCPGNAGYGTIDEGCLTGKIAFGSNRDGNGEIYVMNADGSNQRNLTNNPAWDEDPDWSLDGTKIAFGSDRDGNGEIYVMNADGSNQTRLTNNPASDFYPNWSPDGTKIAFTSYRDWNHEIYVMYSNGSSQVRLTNNPAEDLYPAWSPDGTKIAFYSNRDWNYEIYVMNADGSNQTRLTNNPAWDYYPNWSPDGTKIAFGSDRDGNVEIYVMNADGSNQINLTNNPADDFFPIWSLDGSNIVFVSSRDGNYEIYVMNSNGSSQVRLTNNPGMDWTPTLFSGSVSCIDKDIDGYYSTTGCGTLVDCNDNKNTVYPNAPELCDGIDNQCPSNAGYGTIDEGCGVTGKIAFSSNRDGNAEIYVMNSDGSNQVRLTNNPASDFDPDWSPDGTKIAFRSDRDGNYEIYVMNSDGSNQVRLTNNPAWDWEPAWSPDGTKIAFVSYRDGNDEIYVMNSDGSNQTRLTNNPAWDYEPAWSPDGTKIAFVSYRDGNYEIYVMNSDGSNQVRLTNNPAWDKDPDWSP